MGDMTLVHGSLDQPHTFGYISDKELARDHFDKQTTRLSFYGHTHIPGHLAGERQKDHLLHPERRPDHLGSRLPLRHRRRQRGPTPR